MDLPKEHTMKYPFSAWKPLFTLCMALGITLPGYAADNQSWSGTLYRNGGHFGTANSDTQLESAQPATPASAPKSENPVPGQQVYADTLYRNGGHYGSNNSDIKLETSGQ
jgi:hypothetical protein